MARPIDPRDEPDLMRALQIAAWCNNAQVTPRPRRARRAGRSSATPPKGRWWSPR